MRETPSAHSERDEESYRYITSDAEGRLLATSIPPISHPHSVRPVPESFYFLQEIDSENTGTAIAQVGRLSSPVPPSQKLENGKWRNWLQQPSSPVDTDVAVEGSRVSLEHRVSPGVSELRPPAQRAQYVPQIFPSCGGSKDDNPGRIGPGDHRDLDKLLSSSDTSQILSRYEDLVSRLARPARPAQVKPSETYSSTTDHALEGSTDGNMLTETHGVDLGTSGVNRVQQESDVQSGVEKQQNCTILVDDVETLQSEHLPVDHPSAQAVLAVQETSATSDGTESDAAWKTFLFGDDKSDDVSKAAFEEAFAQVRRDALQRLRPSDSSASPGHEPASEGHSNIATVGTMYTVHRHGTSESTEALESLSKHDHLASDEVESEQLESTSDASAAAPSVEANAGSSGESAAETSGDMLGTVNSGSGPDMDGTTSESLARPPSITTSLAVAPPRSHFAPGETEAGTQGEQFRFSQPRLFVGSRSNNVSQPNRGTEPGVGISLAKRRRGRPRRRANDGRADIRALPNYSSDPIEEYDEERGMARHSTLFPALELA